MKRLFSFIAIFVITCSLPAFAAGDDCVNCIAIYGDSALSNEVHQKLINVIYQLAPNVVFHLGDAVQDSSADREWDDFNKITANLRSKAEFYRVIGNHDKNAEFYTPDKTKDNKGWYALERYGIHFIILNSNLNLKVNSKQYAWLEAKLMHAQDNKPIIVLMHNTIFSIGYHAGSGVKFKDSLIPLFEKYRVSLVFSGHDHNYQRFLYKGIYYIIIGGAGTPLHPKTTKDRYNQKFIEKNNFCTVSRTNRQLIISIYDMDLKLLDKFRVPLHN